MMPGRRDGQKEIRYGGYVYRPRLSISEQPSVLRVSCKFSHKAPEDVSITKEELLGFASVYQRIYHVPDKTRDRLKRWRKAHLRMVESWRMEFWHSKDQDHRQGLKVRKPGIPPEALNPAAEAVDSDDQTADHEDMDVDESSDAPQTREPTPLSSPPAQQLHPLLLAQMQSDQQAPAAQGTPSAAQLEVDLGYFRAELKFARDSIRDLLVWFHNTAVTVDEEDPLKKPLMKKSVKAAEDLKRVSQAARNAITIAKDGKPETAEEVSKRILERRAAVARATQE